MFQSIAPPIIFQKYPYLNKYIPWSPLGKFPTPVHQLAKLESALGFDSLWIKRDDQSGHLGGGNKVRKLEYLLADAKAKGCETLFAVGAAGSNHVRATVVYGKAAGFYIHCLLFNRSHTDSLADNLQVICDQADQVQQVSNRTTLVGRYGYESLNSFSGCTGYDIFLRRADLRPLAVLGMSTLHLNSRHRLRQDCCLNPN